MAKLPQYKSTGTISNQRVISTGATQITNAIAGVADQAFGIAKDWKNAEDSTNSLAAYTEYQREVGELGVEAESEPDFNKKQLYLDKLNKINNNYSSSLPSGEIGNKYRMQMQSDYNNSSIKLSSGFRSKMLEQNKVDYGINREALKKKIVTEQNPVIRASDTQKLRNLTDSMFKSKVISDDAYLRDIESYKDLDVERARNDAYTNSEMFLANIGGYDVDAKTKNDLEISAKSVIDKKQAEAELNLIIKSQDSTNALMNAIAVEDNPTSATVMSAEQALANGEIDDTIAKSLQEASLSIKTLNASTNNKALTAAQQSLDIIRNTTYSNDRDYAEAITLWKAGLLKQYADGEFSKNTMINILSDVEDTDDDKLSKGLIDASKQGAWFGWSFKEPFARFKEAANNESDAYGMFRQYYDATVADKSIKGDKKKFLVEDIVNEYQGAYKTMYSNPLDSLTDDELFSRFKNMTTENIASTAKALGKTVEEVKAQIRLDILQTQ